MKAFDEEALRRRILGWGADLVGYGDVRQDLADEFGHLPRAISLAVRHHPGEAHEYWKGDVRLVSHQDGVIDYRLERIQRRIVAALRRSSYRFFVIPPDSEAAPERFAARLYPKFTHKRAATCAGLGWIGKSGLLVNPRYGCGLSWATVLTDAPVPPARPITESKCGTCEACVEACPVGAIRGVLWHRGTDMDRLVDVELCMRQVAANERLSGRYICGRCTTACPIGVRDAVGGPPGRAHGTTAAGKGRP